MEEGAKNMFHGDGREHCCGRMVGRGGRDGRDRGGVEGGGWRVQGREDGMTMA